jgi:hypothetical protein
MATRPLGCSRHLHPVGMNEHPESSPTPRQGVGPDGELRTEIDDARWRYDKVMEAVTGADLKASIIATVQAAALGALLTTATPTTLTAPSRTLFIGGVGALLAGVATAGAAIFPRHGLRRPPPQHDALHFSDLQQWQPAKLVEHLASQSEQQRLEALGYRLVWASKIAWRKYVCLQWSLLAAGAAAALLTAAYLLSRLTAP